MLSMKNHLANPQKLNGSVRVRACVALRAMQVLKLSVTCSLCAIEIILIPVLSSNTGVFLPRVHKITQKKAGSLDLKLASEGNKMKGCG